MSIQRSKFQDGNRLYYEPWELRMFENIECEWPLFFCYLILDFYFQGNKDAAGEYTEQLEEVSLNLIPKSPSKSTTKCYCVYMF